MVSEEIEKQRAKNYHFSNGVRGEKPDWYNWLNFFLDASQRMADKLNLLLDKAAEIVNI
ncbi:hypothetical protein [Viridibacillus arvi]|uniref:hypothetical protein n=1 Tax=Viridibacillus arvi TaxID=263475 RepID=UPI001B80B5EF|nr:hypothetical protein [Viridibacillus arvi]